MAYESSNSVGLSVSWCGFSVSCVLSTRPFVRHLLIPVIGSQLEKNVRASRSGRFFFVFGRTVGYAADPGLAD